MDCSGMKDKQKPSLNNIKYFHEFLIRKDYLRWDMKITTRIEKLDLNFKKKKSQTSLKQDLLMFTFELSQIWKILSFSHFDIYAKQQKPVPQCLWKARIKREHQA